MTTTHSPTSSISLQDALAFADNSSAVHEAFAALASGYRTLLAMHKFQAAWNYRMLPLAPSHDMLGAAAVDRLAREKANEVLCKMYCAMLEAAPALSGTFAELAAPEDHKLVPVEPTLTMLAAGAEAIHADPGCYEDIAKQFRAMMLAAPLLPLDLALGIDTFARGPESTRTADRPGRIETPSGRSALQRRNDFDALGQPDDWNSADFFKAGWDAAYQQACVEAKEQARIGLNAGHAAMADLALISEDLGLDPDDGGAEPILKAISQLRATQPADAAAIRELIDACNRMADDAEDEGERWVVSDALWGKFDEALEHAGAALISPAKDALPPPGTPERNFNTGDDALDTLLDMVYDMGCSTGNHDTGMLLAECLEVVQAKIQNADRFAVALVQLHAISRFRGTVEETHTQAERDIYLPLKNMLPIAL